MKPGCSVDKWVGGKQGGREARKGLETWMSEVCSLWTWLQIRYVCILLERLRGHRLGENRRSRGMLFAKYTQVSLDSPSPPEDHPFCHNPPRYGTTGTPTLLRSAYPNLQSPRLRHRSGIPSEHFLSNFTSCRFAYCFFSLATFFLISPLGFATPQAWKFLAPRYPLTFSQFFFFFIFFC